MEIKRGKIIVIEGTDASGKETQTVKLIETLRAKGIPCETISFPRYNTPTGKMVARYLGKEPFKQEFGFSDSVNPKLASVLYAEDRFFAKPEMEAVLSSGKNLILNRYVESNMGHQGGKILDASEREEYFRWLEELEHGNFGLPRPDKVIFLYMPYQVCMELKKGRPGKADGHENNPEHLKNAEKSYLHLARLYNWIKIDCTIDGTIQTLKSREKIAEEVYEVVSKLL